MTSKMSVSTGREIEIRYVPLSYEKNKRLNDNLDQVIFTALRVCDGRDVMRREFDGSVDCHVVAGSTGSNERYPCFYVQFNEIESGKLEAALDRYFSVVGTPYHIKGQSTKDVRPVLQSYGKDISSIENFLLKGCKVVDIKPQNLPTAKIMK